MRLHDEASSERRVGFNENTARQHRRGGWSEVTVTSGQHTQKDKETQQRIESDIRWGLKDPESGDVAQACGRPARDRGLALPKTCESVESVPTSVPE